ncbi:MAG: lytic transglycosylase domain-containing protein [Gemmatimonadaceae bacterium]
MRFASIVALLLAIACEHAASDVASGQGVRGQPETPVVTDTAAGGWLARAKAQPEIASWLYLRAAAVTRDSAARRSLYGRVTLPLARTRIPWVEADARESFGDTAGALTAYSKLPAPITVLRLRAAVHPGSRDSVRTEIVALIGSSSSAASVREAAGVFDALFRKPTQTELLSIARASARVGWWSRARTAYSSVPHSALGSHDRFTFATVLSRLNADTRAASEYATITAPASLAAAARYQRARALLGAGDATTAQSVLKGLAKGSDTSSAAALALLADLQTDRNDDEGGRATLLSLIKRFPNTRFAPVSRFDAALIALILGDPQTAELEFHSLATTNSAYALAAEYWLGRARQQVGDSAGARAAWTHVLRVDSTSYYASLAAKRLGVPSMHSVPTVAGFPHVAQVDSAMVRVSLLQRFGMSEEAAFENNELYRAALADSTRLLATAAAFSGTDQAARAIALGRTALQRVGSTPDVWRLIYPVAARDTIVAESRKAGLDPALVAALIRQESNFNPGARSPAGARGLMQVMPAVGQAVAPSVGIKSWNPALLYDPGINIEIGIRHLAPLVKSESDISRTLAAYNAGASRVTRWAKKRGADDPEIFTERIPFLETEGYVKSVLRNREFYRALYAW